MKEHMHGNILSILSHVYLLTTLIWKKEWKNKGFTNITTGLFCYWHFQDTLKVITKEHSTRYFRSKFIRRQNEFEGKRNMKFNFQNHIKMESVLMFRLYCILFSAIYVRKHAWIVSFNFIYPMPAKGHVPVINVTKIDIFITLHATQVPHVTPLH